MRFSGLHGLKDNGESQDKPVLIGTYRIPQWILESDKNRIESTFSSELTLGYSGIAYDSGFDYVHFIETTVPTLNSTHFNLNDYTKIYVGTGNSYYEDYILLQSYLETPFWAGYAEKLDTWFNYIAKSSVPSDYEVQEYIQSDNINTILPSLSFTNDSRFTIDCSFTYMEESGQAVQGNINSGLKGDKTNGLIFSFSNHTETLQAQDEWIDDTERLYDISIKENTIKLNGVTLYAGANGSVESGEVTLFSGFVGRIWGLKFYNNSQLVSNLIPVYKKSTYQVGLYDIIRGNFYIGLGYSSPDINRGILTENGDAVLLEEGFDYLKINNTTNNSKISELQEITNNLNNFYTLGVKDGSNKKYNLGTIETEIFKASNSCGIENFDPDIEYNKGDFTKYNNRVYKFEEPHSGEWLGSDVSETSALEEIMTLEDAETNQHTVLHFTTDDYEELDWIESNGSVALNTGISGGNNDLKIEIKFSYSTYVKNGYVFGNYYGNANYNTTRLILGDTDNNSAYTYVNTKPSGGNTTITSGLLTKNTPHVVTMWKGNVIVDGSTITGGSTTQGTTANNTVIYLFGNNSNGTSQPSKIGMRLYYCKIYDGENLVREYKPYKKGNEVGLVEVISNDFSPLPYSYLQSTSSLSGSQVSVKIYNNEQIQETRNLIINNSGNCEFNLRRDQKYIITPPIINNYNCNFRSLESFSDVLSTKDKKPPE